MEAGAGLERVVCVGAGRRLRPAIARLSLALACTGACVRAGEGER
jgi:hypothetical protein